jgi:NAD(P)-dependent dehydrogenase (short-subunit alcohol dehydrogenase family)
MNQQANKTAIITGSGRGIGKETAIILAKKSVNVVVTSRTRETADVFAYIFNPVRLGNSKL